MSTPSNRPTTKSAQHKYQTNWSLTKKLNSNEIVVNRKSNFKSHLVRCQAIMDNPIFDDLIIRSIGGANSRALNLAMQLNSNNFNVFEIIPKNYSADLVIESSLKRPVKGASKDSFDPDAIDIADDKLKLKKVHIQELRVRKSKLEIDKMKQLRRRDNDKDSRH